MSLHDDYLNPHISFPIFFSPSFPLFEEEKNVLSVGKDVQNLVHLTICRGGII